MKNYVFTNYSIYRVECENMFCKTNIKLKVLKLNKTKFISKSWRHKIENFKHLLNDFVDVVFVFFFEFISGYFRNIFKLVVVRLNSCFK